MQVIDRMYYWGIFGRFRSTIVIEAAQNELYGSWRLL